MYQKPGTSGSPFVVVLKDRDLPDVAEGGEGVGGRSGRRAMPTSFLPLAADGGYASKI
jgi:hypothetical protein